MWGTQLTSHTNTMNLLISKVELKIFIYQLGYVNGITNNNRISCHSLVKLFIIYSV